MNNNQQQPKPRQPDYDVLAMVKDTELKGKVGAAWANQDGSIYVKLNPFVRLEQRGGLFLTLFPAERKTSSYDRGLKQNRPAPEQDDLDYMDRVRAKKGDPV